MTIEGTTDPAFTKVRDAFESCFADGLERGAAVAVVIDGRTVADLWGGHADAAQTRPWQADTLVNIWSATKGVTALAVAMLVERGKLDYAAPIANIWPEFAANGKGEITLETAMSHQAGLDGLSTPISRAELCAWFPYVEALSDMAPLWEPGSRCVYHALSYGYLTGEPIRRATGAMPGRFFANEIAAPLGIDSDLYLGLPAGEDHRAAEMIEGPGTYLWVDALRQTPYIHALHNPEIDASIPNDRAWRAAESPGGNGQATARALATIYGTLARGGEIGGRRLLSADTLSEAVRPRFDGLEATHDLPTAFGAGFRLKDPSVGPRPSQANFGHTGWGGTIGFADPETTLGFGFTTNFMRGFDPDTDPRRTRLIETVYDCV